MNKPIELDEYDYDYQWDLGLVCVSQNNVKIWPAGDINYDFIDNCPFLD